MRRQIKLYVSRLSVLSFIEDIVESVDSVIEEVKEAPKKLGRIVEQNEYFQAIAQMRNKKKQYYSILFGGYDNSIKDLVMTDKQKQNTINTIIAQVLRKKRKAKAKG